MGRFGMYSNFTVTDGDGKIFVPVQLSSVPLLLSSITLYLSKGSCLATRKYRQTMVRVWVAGKTV